MALATWKGVRSFWAGGAATAQGPARTTASAKAQGEGHRTMQAALNATRSLDRIQWATWRHSNDHAGDQSDAAWERYVWARPHFIYTVLSYANKGLDDLVFLSASICSFSRKHTLAMAVYFQIVCGSLHLYQEQILTLCLDSQWPARKSFLASRLFLL